MTEYFVSNDKGLLDVEFIVGALASTYWAGQRPRAAIIASLTTSQCFGAYKYSSREQVGFARVVTDGATFSWLCDVIVSPEHRGRGLGKRLVAAVLADPSIASTPVYLGTKDAHGLYEKYGFCRWELMRRPTSQPNQALEPTVRAGTAPPAQDPRQP